MNTSFLKKLNLHKKNEGTWTGQKSLKSDTYIESFSPVDGELIGSVSVTSKKDYEKVHFNIRSISWSYSISSDGLGLLGKFSYAIRT